MPPNTKLKKNLKYLGYWFDKKKNPNSKPKTN